jgi:DNA-binding CsgD family transcriptional regulator
MPSLLDFLRDLFRRHKDSFVEDRVFEIAEEHGITTDAVLTMASIAAEDYNEKMARWRSLTPREQDVAALVYRGYTNGEIAKRLNISITTVKTHIRKILIKFDLNSKDQFRQYFEGWDFSEVYRW